jgi:hypothetical protein
MAKKEDDGLKKLVEFSTATHSFYLSLGRFLHQFSLLEGVMLILLIRITGVSQEVGKSIYSGTRIAQAKDFINRTLDATNRKKTKTLLKPYFDHIGILNGTRDDILHYGARYDFEEKALIVSNERAAHVSERKRQYIVTPNLLDDMTHDVMMIIHALLREGNPPNLSVPETFEAEHSLAWRYKQPPLISRETGLIRFLGELKRQLHEDQEEHAQGNHETKKS